MKTFKIILTLAISLLLLSGCSNKETSRLYFDSEPYYYFTGKNSSSSYDLLLYRIDGLNRFHLHGRNIAEPEEGNKIWGSWVMANGILQLTAEDGKRIEFSGYPSSPKVIFTEATELLGVEFQKARNLHFYEGISKRGEYSYRFNLRLFDKVKTIPVYIIPPAHQDNTFILQIEESKGGKVVATEEFIGYWNLKERVLFLKLEDEFLHFKTERNTLKLISYNNKYDLHELKLNKVR